MSTFGFELRAVGRQIWATVGWMAVVGVIAGLSLFLFPRACDGEELPGVAAGVFVGAGTSDGDVRKIEFAGLFLRVPSPARGLYWTANAAIGKGETRSEEIPSVDFTGAAVGAQYYLPTGGRFKPFLGAEAWRRTAIVAVPTLGGLKVIEEDRGSAVIFGTDIPAGPWPVTIQTKYEWGRKPPKVESGGLCVGWGLIEGCWSRSKVQSRQIDSLRLTGRYQAWTTARADREERQLKAERLNRGKAGQE